MKSGWMRGGGGWEPREGKEGGEVREWRGQEIEEKEG